VNHAADFALRRGYRTIGAWASTRYPSMRRIRKQAGDTTAILKAINLSVLQNDPRLKLSAAVIFV
jgi:hypothetical protein